MKTFLKLSVFFLIFCICTCISTEKKDTDTLWTLIWNDEFDKDTIDPAKWTYDTGNGFWFEDEWIQGWGNEELAYYTDREKNAYVKNGLLIIRALEETYDGKAGDQEQTFHYTSARLKTKGIFSKLYGRFEFRVRMPKGKGFWPAVWLMPDTDQYGSWAASGEIDIVEARGSDTARVSSTIHFGKEWPDNKSSGELYYFPEGNNYTDFHVYTLEWEPGELRWYVDDTLYLKLNRWYTRRGTYPAPFNRKFHILINLAVGGHHDGDPDETTIFPGMLEVDYVRVYELTGRPYRFPEKPPEQIPPEPRPENARPVPEDGNEVYNNTFTRDESYDPDDPLAIYTPGIPGMGNWFFLHLPEFGGDGTVTIEETGGRNFARIDISKVGIQPYSVQLIQRVPVIRGHKYKASFTAKASSKRNIQVKINGDEDNSWVAYSNVESIALTGEFREYEITFTMEYNTDSEARYEFNLGLDYNSVWIGNVRLEDITGNE